MKHLGDITKINGFDIPIVDIVTGGSPCQDLSVAGKRAGLKGERSGLFMEQIRIIKEMRENDRRNNGRTGVDIRPRHMVWENVPGAFSSNKGEDFRCVLEETAKVADSNAIIPRLATGKDGKQKWSKSGCIMGDGWSIAWRVHDAQFWGVPQRRKRISLVADFGGETAPEILFECKGLSGDSEESGKPGESAAADVESDITETGGAISFQERGGKPGGGKGILIQEEHVGALSTLNNQRVCSEVLGLNRERCGAVVLENHPNDSRVKIREDGKVQTLSSRMETGGGNVPMVLEKKTYSIDEKMGNTYVHEEQGNTLGARDYKQPQAVVTYQNTTGTLSPGAHAGSYNGQDAYNDMLITQSYQEHTGTVDACIGKGTSDQLANNDMFVANTSVVRRLTPLECERLQGYPDGWTDIGEWYDSKGKKHKDADSPRYKALGNSIALPFWQWMAERICRQYDRPTTMASLFDGIGGFPLVFSRCGCKPLWASEIEEFPIAVTKIRFESEG